MKTFRVYTQAEMIEVKAAKGFSNDDRELVFADDGGKIVAWFAERQWQWFGESESIEVVA